MYNIQTFYGWQTQYKCVMSTHKIFYEYTTNVSTFNHEIHNEHTVNYPITHKIHNEHSANYLRRPRNTQRTHR